jgi:large subunit ribosomal protein L29
MKITALLTAIRESSDEELKARVKRLEEELFQHRLKRYTNQLENTNLIRQARREIARCKSVLSARALGREQKKAAAEAKE